MLQVFHRDIVKVDMMSHMLHCDYLQQPSGWGVGKHTMHERSLPASEWKVRGTSDERPSRVVGRASDARGLGGAAPHECSAWETR